MDLWLLWLLRLDAPDIRARLQFGDVIGVMVALVAGSGGLGSLGHGRSVLLLLLMLLRWLASMVEQSLLLDGARVIRGLPREVEVLPNCLLRYGSIPAKRVVIESIVGLVKLVGKAIVGLLEVEA